MRLVARLHAAALAALAVPGAANAQDAHEKLAAGLIAVLPPAGAERSEPDPFAVQRSADLRQRYPAKSAAIAAAFADRAKCSDLKRDAAVARSMLAIARSLSDEDLRAMTAFYSGPDHAAAEKMVEGSPEWVALFARYPLQRFNDAMQAQMGAKMIDEVIAAEDGCEAELTAALARGGIGE